MRIKANHRTGSWLAALVAAIVLLPGAVWGQTTPQDHDDVWDWGNAPYSNPLPAEHAPLTPFAPVGFKNYWKWFAPVDISDYGNGIKPRRGFFFSYERMLMSTSRATPTGIGANNAMEGDQLQFLNVITSPISAPITSPTSGGQAGNTAINAPPSSYPLFPTATTLNPAFPNASPITPVFFNAGSINVEVPFSSLTQQNLVGENYNSNSTSALTSRWGNGNRWEFGYVDVDDTGWLVSVLDHISTGQELSLPGGTVLFNDPTGFLQGFETSIGAVSSGSTLGSLGSGFDADLNGNHIYGRNGYALPTETVTPGQAIASIPPVIIPTVTTLTFPTTPNSPAPGDYGLYFPQINILNNKAVPAGTPGSTTFLQAGGDEVVFTPSFTTLVVADKVTTTGVEFMRLIRQPTLHNGGNLDFIYGVRYLQVNDIFQVYGFGGGFDSMAITQKVLNNVIGPQIGARYSKQRGRWSFFTEGRFFPAANFAVERNNSVLASNSTPLVAQLAQQEANGASGQTTTSSSSSSSTTVAQGPLIAARDKPAGLVNGGLTTSAGLNNMQFSPSCEFRAGFSCWLTQGLAIKSSYTGIFLPNMTRAANSIDYTLPNIGILPGGHHECVMLNGFTLGLELNR